MTTPYSFEWAPAVGVDSLWADSELERIADEPIRESESYRVEPFDYTGGYEDDAILHTTINDRLAPFYGAFVIGANTYILNEATADRPDTQRSTGRHEIAHYHFPNHHMNRVSYEHLTLAMSDTVYSEQPRGIATFEMRDLDIRRAYENQRYVN